tara:strand:+ start:616 stop:984 length:369 start_codon:yes stop_codon:yes gene_type:complete
MADTYTWNINTLDRELSDGVVYTVHWTLNASRPNPNVSGESYTAGAYGSEGYQADPSDPGFVSYDNLTQAICIGWVQDSLGSEGVTSLESGLSANLDEQEDPTEAAGVPWATTMDISTADLG